MVAVTLGYDMVIDRRTIQQHVSDALYGTDHIPALEYVSTFGEMISAIEAMLQGDRVEKPTADQVIDGALKDFFTEHTLNAARLLLDGINAKRKPRLCDDRGG